MNEQIAQTDLYQGLSEASQQVLTLLDQGQNMDGEVIATHRQLTLAIREVQNFLLKEEGDTVTTEVNRSIIWFLRYQILGTFQATEG